MEKIDENQYKTYIYMQLALITAFTIANIVNFFIKIFILKNFTCSIIFFAILNLLYFTAFYILKKVNVKVGNHLFYTLMALTILAVNIFQKDLMFNNSIIYIIPIMLTMVNSDRLFTFLYSLIFILIITLSQILLKNYSRLDFFIVLVTISLAVTIILIYDSWIRSIHKSRIDTLTELHSSTMKILGRVAELKDEDTHNHLERVAIIVDAITMKLKKYSRYSGYITDFYKEDLKAAATLHDIGKIGIKDTILLKPGKLNNSEYDEMKAHANIGADLLLEVQKKVSNKEIFNMAVEIARHHHERWDGAGYPDHLKGRDIPLSARIMAVADVYDALISPRPYKKAFSHDDAYRIIKNSSASQFDPDVVKCFTKIHLKIYDRVKVLL